MGRKRYSEEFRREAVRLVEEGQSVEQVAIDLGVGKTTLWRWREQLSSGRKEGPRPETDEELRKENERLRKRLRVLEEEREILKKAATFFAKESK